MGEEQQLATVPELGLESTGKADPTGGHDALATREQAELQGSFVMAKRFPRDEQGCYVRAMKSAQRPSFAVGALYSYRRAGTLIEGPSVKMARELGRCWGNLRYGYRVADRNAQYTTVEGYCLDLETNAQNIASASFKNLIYRKRGGWQEPDERDYRELVAKNGAIVVRNAILQVLPPDIVDELCRESLKTQRKAADGEIKQDREQTIRHLALSFAKMQVTTEMLENHLGHSVDLMTPEELVELRNIGISIRDGQSKREEHFEIPDAPDRKPAAAQASDPLNELGTKPDAKPAKPPKAPTKG